MTYNICILFFLLTSMLNAFEIEKFSSLSKKLDDEQTKVVSEKITKHFYERNFEKAFSIIAHYSKIDDGDIKELGKLTQDQFFNIYSTLGKELNYKFVRKTEIKGLLLEYVYVIQYANTLIRWEFIFYNNSKDWSLHTFKWDDNVFKVLNSSRSREMNFLPPDQVEKLLENLPINP